MQTLYRKYRPSTFEEVVGQDEIVTVLKKSIENNTISHAYLFSGTRGTGKTSIARIFAKELHTSDQDIYELDAASYTGVDTIRDLRSGVSTIPFDSKYKVYIIDEAHMLSTAAANALLKTLEEPPAHVIFILATTEKHKILDTIKSRCMIFDFNSPSATALKPFINDTAKKEGKNIEAEAVRAIAKQGEGSYRDTLSVLQKVLSTGENTITLKHVQNLYSSSHTDLAFSFTKALINDQQKLLSMLKKETSLFDHPKENMDQVITVMREALRAKHGVGDKNKVIDSLNTKHLKDVITLRQEMEESNDPALLLELFIFNAQEQI